MHVKKRGKQYTPLVKIVKKWLSVAHTWAGARLYSQRGAFGPGLLYKPGLKGSPRLTRPAAPCGGPFSPGLYDKPGPKAATGQAPAGGVVLVRNEPGPMGALDPVWFSSGTFAWDQRPLLH